MAGKAAAQAEQKGSRWFDKEPSGDEVASWFVAERADARRAQG
jgi:hypothetical protein